MNEIVLVGPYAAEPDQRRADGGWDFAVYSGAGMLVERGLSFRAARVAAAVLNILWGQQ